MRKQFRLFFLHLIVVICWNLQVRCDLPMGNPVNFQRFHNLPSLIIQMQVRPTGIRFHLKAFCVHQIVLLDLILSLKFQRELLQAHSFFHIFTSLLRFFTRRSGCLLFPPGRSGRSPPAPVPAVPSKPFGEIPAGWQSRFPSPPV